MQRQNICCFKHAVDKCGASNKEPIFKVEYLICYVCCEMLIPQNWCACASTCRLDCVSGSRVVCLMKPLRWHLLRSKACS